MTEAQLTLKDDLAVDSLAQERLRFMYDFWDQYRMGRPLPPDSVIDPLHMPRECLPFLSVFEVEREPLRFRTRLVGTALVRELGEDQTGCYVDEVSGARGQLARLTWCAHRGRPYFASHRATFSERSYKHYNALVLPFADGTGAVSRIVAVFECD